MAGLAGGASVGASIGTHLLPLVGVAFVGGSLGAYSGAKHMSNAILKKILAITLLIAALKLLFS
jgi:uncharacterized membrane protein YfcA